MKAFPYTRVISALILVIQVVSVAPEPNMTEVLIVSRCERISGDLDNAYSVQSGLHVPVRPPETYTAQSWFEERDSKFQPTGRTPQTRVFTAIPIIDRRNLKCRSPHPSIPSACPTQGAPERSEQMAVDTATETNPWEFIDPRLFDGTWSPSPTCDRSLPGT